MFSTRVGGRTQQSMKKALISMVTKVEKNFKTLIAVVQKIKDSYGIYINYLILFLSEKCGICFSGLYCIFRYMCVCMYVCVCVCVYIYILYIYIIVTLSSLKCFLINSSQTLVIQTYILCTDWTSLTKFVHMHITILPQLFVLKYKLNLLSLISF